MDVSSYAASAASFDPQMMAATTARATGLGHIPAAPTVDKTGEDFEAMFLSQMLQPMFNSVEIDDTFGGGHGEEVMRSFMIQEYGKALAAQPGFSAAPTSLGGAIKAEMIRRQGHKKSGQSSTMDIVS